MSGQDGTPATVTPTPLSSKSDELVMEATGVAANTDAASRKRITYLKLCYSQLPSILGTRLGQVNESLILNSRFWYYQIGCNTA